MKLEKLLESSINGNEHQDKKIVNSANHLQPLNQSIADLFDKDVISNAKKDLIEITRKYYNNKELVYALQSLIEKVMPAKDILSLHVDLFCRVKIKGNNQFDKKLSQDKSNEMLKFTLIIGLAEQVKKDIEKYDLDKPVRGQIDNLIKSIVDEYTACKNILKEIDKGIDKEIYERLFGRVSVYYCGTGEYFHIPEATARQLVGVPFSTKGQLQSDSNNYVEPFDDGKLFFKSVKDESLKECFDTPEEQKLEGDTLKVREASLSGAFSMALYNPVLSSWNQTTVAPTSLLIATNVRVLVEPSSLSDQKSTIPEEWNKIKQIREDKPLFDILSQDPELILALLDKEKWQIKFKNADPVKTLVSLGCGKFTLDHILYLNQLIVIFESAIGQEEFINELIEFLYPIKESADKERAKNWFENLKNKYPNLTKIINECCVKYGFDEEEINSSIEFLLTLKKFPITFSLKSDNDINDVLLKDIVSRQLSHCKNFFKFVNNYNLTKFVALDLIHLLCGDTKADNIAVEYDPTTIQYKNIFYGNRLIDYVGSNKPVANLVCIDAAEIYTKQILCEHIGEKGHKIGHKQVLFWLLFNSEVLIDNDFCQYITNTSIAKLMLPMINALQSAHQQHDIGIKSIGKLARNAMDVVLQLYHDELSTFAKRIERFVEFVGKNKGSISYRKMIEFLLDPIVYYAMEKQIAKFNGNVFGAFIDTTYLNTNLEKHIFDGNDLARKQDWLETGEKITLEQALSKHVCKATDLVNERKYPLEGEIIRFFAGYVDYNKLTYEDFIEITEVMVKHMGWDTDLKSNKKYTATKLKYLYKVIEEYDVPKVQLFLEIMDNLKYAYDGQNIFEKILGQFEINILKILDSNNQDYLKIGQNLDACLKILSLVLNKFPDLIKTFTITHQNTYDSKHKNGSVLTNDTLCSLARIVVDKCRYASNLATEYCKKLLQLCIDNGIELCNSEYIVEFKKPFTPLQMELKQFFDAYSGSQKMPQFGSIMLLLNSGVELGFNYFEFLKKVDRINEPKLNRLDKLNKIFPKQIIQALFLRYEGFRREVLLFPNGRKADNDRREQLFYDNGYTLIAKSLDPFDNHKLWANQFLAMNLIEAFFSLVPNQFDSQLSLIPLANKKFFALEHFDHFDSQESYRLDEVLKCLESEDEIQKNNAISILRNIDSWQFTQFYLGSLLTHMIIPPDNITLVKIGSQYHLKVNNIIQCFEPHIDNSTGSQRLTFVNIILLVSQYVKPAKIPAKLKYTEEEVGRKLLNWYDRMDALDKETGLLADGKLYNTIFLEKIYNRLLDIFDYIHKHDNFTFGEILKETKYFAYLLYDLVNKKGLSPLKSYKYLEKNEYLMDEQWSRAHSGTTKENTRVASIHSLDENQVSANNSSSREILKNIVGITYDTFLNSCNNGNVKILDQYNIELFIHRLAKDPKLNLYKMNKSTIKKYMKVYIALKTLREFRLYSSNHVAMKSLKKVLKANHGLRTLSIEKCLGLTDFKTILVNSSLMALNLKGIQNLGMEIKEDSISFFKKQKIPSSKLDAKKEGTAQSNFSDRVNISLKTYSIDDCTIRGGALDLRFLPSLSRLEIKDCNNLSILTLHPNAPLQHLELINCPKLNGETILASLNKPQVLRKIEVLRIENCPEINASCLVAELVDLSQINPSAQISFKLPGGELQLQDLEFSGRKIQITDNHLNALTKNHFDKSLAKLTLQNCEKVTLQGLSTIIDNFQSLQTISVKTSNLDFILNLDLLRNASKIVINSIGNNLCISVNEKQVEIFQFLVPLVQFIGLGELITLKGSLFVIDDYHSHTYSELLGFLKAIGVSLEIRAEKKSLPISPTQKRFVNLKSADSSGLPTLSQSFFSAKPMLKPSGNSTVFDPKFCKNELSPACQFEK